MNFDPDSTESLRLRANKLEILERLADDLAHEIKNPLHSMVINLEVLKRRVARWGEGEPDDVLRFVAVLGSELDRVNRRIDLLLRLARPARAAETTAVDELVNELLELIQLEGRRHEVEVSFEPLNETLRVHAPREPVRQVVLNLVLDALERVSPGGRVVIRTEEIDGGAAVVVGSTLPDGASAPAERAPRRPLARDVAERIGGSVVVAESGSDEAGASSVIFRLPPLGS